MKEKRLNYSEGYKAMEREYQKQLYVSQLERQHQLQQVQVRLDYYSNEFIL